MTIQLNTQQKLNTYLLERLPGQLFDVYYRAIEEYVNGPIYRILNVACNDLFISSATPHGLDSWELFYTRKPGEMPYIKWAELLILLNKIAREGPTFSNIRALLRFFDPSADISLVGSLAVLSEDSAFKVGTPVPPFDQRTEYVILEEDSEFVLNPDDPPEFIVYDRDTILYETTILNVTSDSYRELLKTLLRQLLPANVRVNVKFVDRIEVYTYGNIGGDVSSYRTVYRSKDLTSWTSTVVDGSKIIRMSPFHGAESGVLVITSEEGDAPPYRYFKIVDTSVTEIVPEDLELIKNQLFPRLYSFGPDHMMLCSPRSNKLTKIKVNNITTSVIQKQIQPTDRLTDFGIGYSVGWFSTRPTIHEQYIMDYTSRRPLRTVRIYDRDLNLVSIRHYSSNVTPTRVFPITKDKAFIVSVWLPRVQFCDFSRLPSNPVVSEQFLNTGGMLGETWNFEGICVADSRSLVLGTIDYSDPYVRYRYYNWNPYTNLYTLVYSNWFQPFGALSGATIVGNTLLLFFSKGVIVKIDDYSKSPKANTYYIPLGNVTSYEYAVTRSSDQSII